MGGSRVTGWLVVLLLLAGSWGVAADPQAAGSQGMEASPAGFPLARGEVDPLARSSETGAPASGGQVATIDDGRVRVDVHVPVILAGFSSSEVQALAERLDPETVDHRGSDLNQPLPPDPERGVDEHLPLSGEVFENPIVPTAVYDVEPLPPEVSQGITDRIGSWELDDEPGTYEGRSLEAYLANALPAAGVELDPQTPALVLVNGSAFLEEPYTWRYTLPNGYLEPVEVFGERAPLLLADTNALGLASDANGLDAVERLVRNATHYRLLQGPVYPVTPNACHAVTVITAYHPVSLSELYPGMEDIQELVDAERIEQALRALAGPAATVHVDATVLELPADDPALDALSRTGFEGFEAQRAWLSANWERYWVPHDGCTPYVSLLALTDPASNPSFLPGIATYDEDTGHRIALSWLSDVLRFQTDPASPLVDERASVDRYRLPMELHTHELGHLFGLRHPHQIDTAEGYGVNRTFATVFSGVSYAASERVNSFGAIEQANMLRNQAGAVVAEAVEQGLRGSAPFEDAMDALAENDWALAIERLEPHLDHDPQTSSTLPTPEQAAASPTGVG